VRMSPNMFSVTITSKSRGRLQQMHGRGVHQHVLEAHVGKLRRQMRSTVARHRREVSSTLALSTEVSLRGGPRASSAASRTTRSISADAVAAHVDGLGGGALSCRRNRCRR
jgi:hypothetical protein